MQIQKHTVDPTTAPKLIAAIEAKNSAEIAALLEALPHSEALREISNLETEQRDAAFALMPVELAAELVEAAPSELAAELIEHMNPEQGAHVLEELESDAQADVIGEMHKAQAEAVLTKMDAEEAADVRQLIQYDENSAGGLMSTDTLTFQEDSIVGAVLARLASEEYDLEHYRGQHPYIVNDKGDLVGVISLRSLLTARKSQELSEIMVEPLTANVNTSLETLEDIFDEHSFLGLPVVDSKNKLVGALSRSAVADAVAKRAESESLRRQGVFGDELRSMPLAIRSKRRLMWLSANIGLNILAASVISAHEETLAAVIAIAIFLPMVSDMSGCSGNQAVGVTMRELSLGLVRPIDAMRVWMKEVSVGLINGVVLGILIGLVAWVWKGNVWLGVVIGLALAINTVLAVSIGGVVPLLLKKLGQDPAAASGPLLTTITDMAGFFLVLSLASLFMPLLV